MDAMEFIKARERMCNSYNSCAECPLRKEACSRFFGISGDKIVPIVEQWAKDHPIKTRQSVFLEQWPEAAIDEGGSIDICPADLVEGYRKSSEGQSCIHVDNYTPCIDCRREFWMQEVES